MPDNSTEFAGKPVVDWDEDTGIADPTGIIYRIRIDWDEGEEGKTWSDKLGVFLSDPGSAEITGLSVGAWEGVVTQETAADVVVEALVSARERLPNLRALFFGDIASEESEISWIRQTDISPLLAAYPNLEYLVVRGGDGLSLGRPRLPFLRSLIIQTGGLPAGVVNEICAAELPALEHLELWLGEEGYGATVVPSDLAPILSGDLFPKLKYLGLCDSEIADQVAVAVAASPILERIETLDLSLGTLGDEGAEALLTSPGVARLRKLDIHHHYCTPEVMERLQALPIEVDVSEREDESKYGRYVAVGE